MSQEKYMLKRGFSLVELVVVILLIGILSAVAVPRLFGSVNKAHKAAVQSMSAEMMSALKVMAAEWLMNGSPAATGVDGSIYMISSYGYPDVTVKVDPSVTIANAANDSKSGTADGCKNFLHKIIGLPIQLIGTADDLVEERPENADKTWVAVLTGDSIASGACIFKYQASGARGASIVYAPSLKAAVNVIMPETW